MMIQKINFTANSSVNNNSFGSKKKHSHDYSHIDEKKVLTTMSYMGLIALVGVGLYKQKKISVANKLIQMNNINKAITDSNVYSSASRSANAVQSYYRDVARTKAMSAQYKLKNGFITGKSPKEISYIRNNIKNLKQQAHMA